jgi:hypothetical protein
LCDVVGGVEVAEAAVGDCADEVLVALDEGGESLVVAIAGGCYESGIGLCD